MRKPEDIVLIINEIFHSNFSSYIYIYIYICVCVCMYVCVCVRRTFFKISKTYPVSYMMVGLVALFIGISTLKAIFCRRAVMLQFSP